MTKPISVGDLVQVVKPTVCCNNGDHLGLTFIAGRFVGGGTCGWCHERGLDGPLVTGYLLYIDVRCLKRIPPLDELEGLRTEESTEVSA